MKNGKLKVEKGIPIPERRGLMQTFMRSLKVGDSFLSPRSTRTGIPAAAKGAGIKVTTRVVDAEHIRVWRLK